MDKWSSAPFIHRKNFDIFWQPHRRMDKAQHPGGCAARPAASRTCRAASPPCPAASPARAESMPYLYELHHWTSTTTSPSLSLHLHDYIFTTRSPSVDLHQYIYISGWNLHFTIKSRENEKFTFVHLHFAESARIEFQLNGDGRNNAWPFSKFNESCEKISTFNK